MDPAINNSLFMFLDILNTCLLHIVLMLWEEVLPWSDLKVAATRLRNGS